ncbi:unnamed protein product [Peronospora destructor]|uniref:Uncharacterized protein n=1 Tax=Peronospora destructor TaxID=86335 RepID=A0AAV0U7D5_9STRA|nr:unnamed protein product [Peronospora destructor]
MTDLAVKVDGSFDASDISTDQAKALRQKGNEAFKCRQFQEAKTFYSQAISIQTTSHLLFGNRSAACHRLKDFYGALKDAEKAIELSPDWSKGYLRKGVACESLQQWDDAINAFDKYLRLETKLSKQTKTH